MNPVPLNRTVLLNRLAEIERDVSELSKFQGMPVKEFSAGVHYAVAEHHLRRALEAISMQAIISYPDYPWLQASDPRPTKQSLWLWADTRLCRNPLPMVHSKKWLVIEIG